MSVLDRPNWSLAKSLGQTFDGLTVGVKKLLVGWCTENKETNIQTM